MSDTESPAERVAGRLALDIYQGRIQPGTPVPSADELASAHGVAPPTAIAALTRLERAGIVRLGQSGAMYAVVSNGSPELAVTAAATMCRRLAALPGNGTGQRASDLDRLREAFLAAARRALREGISGQDPAVAAAREVLARGAQVADPGRAHPAPPTAAPARGGVAGWRSVGGRTADFPGPVQPAAPDRGGVAGWRPVRPRHPNTTPPPVPRTP